MLLVDASIDCAVCGPSFPISLRIVRSSPLYPCSRELFFVSLSWVGACELFLYEGGGSWYQLIEKERERERESCIIASRTINV